MTPIKPKKSPNAPPSAPRAPPVPTDDDIKAALEVAPRHKALDEAPKPPGLWVRKHEAAASAGKLCPTCGNPASGVCAVDGTVVD